MSTPHRFTWLALPLAILPSCGVFGPDTAGPDNVDTLVRWVEHVYVESEQARQEVHLTMTRLQALGSGKYEGRSAEAFEAFKAAAIRTRAQALKLAESVQPMQRTAAPVFDKWTADVAAFHNPSMRRRSIERLDATRSRYDAIVRAIGPAQTEFERFNAGMQDHELFLGNDLNASAVASVQADIKAMAILAEELDAQLARCQKLTKAYLAAAMPAEPATPAARPPTNAK